MATTPEPEPPSRAPEGQRAFGARTANDPRGRGRLPRARERGGAAPGPWPVDRRKTGSKHQLICDGKVERLNRTVLDEWAYIRPRTGNTERTAALDSFLHTYNRAVPAFRTLVQRIGTGPAGTVP